MVCQLFGFAAVRSAICAKRERGRFLRCGSPLFVGRTDRVFPAKTFSEASKHARSFGHVHDGGRQMLGSLIGFNLFELQVIRGNSIVTIEALEQT